MPGKFAIKPADDKALIYSPYNPDFVSQLKAMGGRWDASRQCWVVNAQAADAVRQVMREIYGRDDTAPDPSDLVTVVVEFTEDAYADRSAYTLFGFTVAKAWGRDSGAKVGESAAFIKGKPTSGGSRPNWFTEIPAGSVVELYDVPRSIYTRDLPKLWDKCPSLRISIKDNAPTLDRAALEAEKARLLARVAEIDALLSEAHHECR